MPLFCFRWSEIFTVHRRRYSFWFGFARLLIETAVLNGRHLKVSSDRVLPISTAEYTLSAKRPYSSRLDTTILCADYSISIPRWEEQVEQTVIDVLSLDEGLH